MNAQFIAIGIIFLGLYFLTKEKKLAVERVSTREYTRCERCGRPHSVYRKFGLCRECMRELAHKSQLPGVKKASW